MLEGKDLDNPLYLYDTPSSDHTAIDIKENQRMTCIDEIMSDQSIKNPLRRASVPFITQAIADEDSRQYCNWFYEIFRKEKSISIYDPYALTLDSLNSLKYYFPFEKGTRVNIFTNTSNTANQENEKAIQILSDIAKQKSITIIINNIGSRKMHGRHLFLGTSNCFVDLDCGIDFLKSGKVRVDCAITFAKTNNEKEAFRRSYNPVRILTVASNGIVS